MKKEKVISITELEAQTLKDLVTKRETIYNIISHFASEISEQNKFINAFWEEIKNKYKYTGDYQINFVEKELSPIEPEVDATSKIRKILGIIGEK